MVPGLNSPLPTGSWDSLSADITFTFFFFSRFTYTHLFWLCPPCSDPWAPSPPRHWGLNLSHFCPQETVLLKTRGQHVTCQRHHRYSSSPWSNLTKYFHAFNQRITTLGLYFSILLFFLFSAPCSLYAQLIEFQVPNQGLNAQPWRWKCSPNHWTAEGFAIFLKVNHYYILQKYWATLNWWKFKRTKLANHHRYFKKCCSNVHHGAHFYSFLLQPTLIISKVTYKIPSLNNPTQCRPPSQSLYPSLSQLLEIL